MRLVAKIEKIIKTKGKHTYQMQARIKTVLVDMVHISGKIKGKLISVVREFPSDSPEPETGELLVLDEMETNAALKKLIAPAKIPVVKSGEVLLFLDDTNSDSYPELHMTNNIIELSCSPVRGGLITHFAERNREGLLSNDIICGIKGKAVGGVVFSSHQSGKYNLDGTKFRVKGIKSGDAIRYKTQCSSILVAKVGGMNAQIDMELSPKSPLLGLSCTIDNSHKKAKAKKVAQVLKMCLRSIGHKSSAISIIEPSGYAKHFSRRNIYPPWAIGEQWVDYYGDIDTGKSGFFVLRRSDTGENLLISFEPKSVSRSWSNKFLPLPHAMLIYNTERIPKNRKSKCSAFISPMTDFIIKDGFLLGYLRSKSRCFAIAAGITIPKTFMTHGNKKSPVPFERKTSTLFTCNLDNIPDVLQTDDMDIRLPISAMDGKK